jgi:hypothetical protein
LILQIDSTDVLKYSGKIWLPILQSRRSNIFWMGAGINTLGYYNVNNRSVLLEEQLQTLLKHRPMLACTAAAWRPHRGSCIAAVA